MTDSLQQKSSIIRDLSYDAAAKTLTVFFHNGSAYTYAGVPEDLAARFQSADSWGKFFAAHIRPTYVGKKQETRRSR